MVVADPQKHARALRKLLPPGRLLPTAEGSTLGQLLEGLAGELARLEGRACDLMDEADPRTSVELIGDWERVLGLPSDCGPPPTALADRRAAILARLLINQGATIETLRQIAEAWGAPATIRRRKPTQLGLWTLGDGCELGPGEMRFWTNVDFGFQPVKRFVCGVAQCGVDSLGSVNEPEAAICALNEAKPAHTKISITFTEPDVDLVFVLRVDRADAGRWTVELTVAGCLPIIVGAAGGFDVLLAGGTLPVIQRGGGTAAVVLTPNGTRWVLSVVPQGGGSWSVDVAPHALQFNGGGSTVLTVCPTANQIPVTLRGGSTVLANLEEL